jgi:hypothetical protein
VLIIAKWSAVLVEYLFKITPEIFTWAFSSFYFFALDTDLGFSHIYFEVPGDSLKLIFALFNITLTVIVYFFQWVFLQYDYNDLKN